jgi:glycosyltransferase involved in cell wall biosynthesis
MKKICFLLGHYFKYSKGGAELQANFIAKELSKKYEVHYIFIKPPGLNKKDISKIDNGINLHTIKNYDYRAMGKLFFLNYSELYRHLDIIKPNVIYQRGDRAHIGIAAKWCKRNNKKLVLGISMDQNCSKKNILNLKKNIFSYPSNIINGFFTFFGIKKSDCIIAQTKKQQQMLKKNFNKNSIIISNGLSLPNHPFNKKRPPIISWIANIKPLKKPEIFISLAERCSDLDARFVFAGRPAVGSYQNMLLERTKKLSNLNYLGEIPYDKTNELLSESSILVNTSTTEGFSNTYIQAWMRETPVVTLNCDPDDIIKNQGIGFHSKIFEQLVNDVRYLIENENMQKEMGRKAREYSTKYHDLKIIGEKYLKLFNQLIEDS